EELDLGAVGESEAGLGDAAVDHGGEGLAGEEGAEVGVHACGLVHGAAEDADLDAVLEDEVQEGGDGAEEGLAAAAVGPEDAVAWGAGLLEGVPEVVERGVVALDQGAVRGVEVEVLAQER